MKNLRHLCAAAMLTFILTFSTFAGEMDVPLLPPTAPVASAGNTNAPAPAATTTVGQPVVAPSDVEALLGLLQSLLSLF
ncbi:MAG: hypothetical protein ABR577_14385 [Pyrinomonadaceae bacterium]